MKVIGHVSKWFDAKNFGFIHENRDGVLYSYFFHRKHLIEGFPATGETARFDVVVEPKGAVATNVEIFHSRTEMEQVDAARAADVLAGSSADVLNEVKS